MRMKRNVARTALAAGAVAAATAVAAGAAQADPPADHRTHHEPGMQRMHELHMQGNRGMERMHELYMHGNPGMHQMHQMPMGHGSR
jgi:hypothetical protein